MDWEAVFRTIDHQQGSASGSVARQHDQSGTGTNGDGGVTGTASLLTDTNHVFPSNGDWSTTNNGVGEVGQGQAETGEYGLYQQFARHMNGPEDRNQAQAETSTRSRKSREASGHGNMKGAGVAGRTPYTLSNGVSTRNQQALPTSYDGLPHDLPFRAMLHAMSGQSGNTVPDSDTTRHGPAQGQVPLPNTRDSRSSRGRRRSRSLVPRRSTSDGTCFHKVVLCTV